MGNKRCVGNPGGFTPGDDVVDWIAEDPYIFGDSKDWWTDFSNAVNRKDTYTYPNWPGFYTWATVRFPTKPMMVAEWGVWESRANPGHKPYFYNTVGLEIQLYPRVKALVYFDSPDAGGRDSRVDATPAALAAYRDLGHLPVFQVDLPTRPARQ